MPHPDNNNNNNILNINLSKDINNNIHNINKILHISFSNNNNSLLIHYPNCNPLLCKLSSHNNMYLKCNHLLWYPNSKDNNNIIILN